MSDMNNTTNHNFRNLVNEMIAERRAYAAANGFTASDDEIAAHIASSLIRMMKEGA